MWHLAAGVAWVVGALGGVATVALLGDVGPGLLGAAMGGGVACALVAPVVMVPFVAVACAVDDRTGAAAHWHVAGVRSRRRMGQRAAGAARSLAGLCLLGAAAGLLAGLGLGATGPDGVVAGLRAAPPWPVVGVAAAAVGLSLVIGLLLAAAVGDASLAAALWVGAGLATGAWSTVAVFVPALRLTFFAMPWASIWPFTPSLVDAPYLAQAISPAARAASAVGWSAVLVAVARRRLRRDPYPTPHEPVGGR